MSLDIAEEKQGNASFSANGNKVNISGEIYDPNPAKFLKPFFAKIIKQMDNEVIFNLTDLEFINSSAIGCFIYFINARKKNTKIIFEFDSKKPWQQKSFEIMQSFDRDNIQFRFN